MAGLFQRVNWIDIFALILLIRVTYISSRIGVGKQFLPLILLAFILSASLYNYRKVASFFIERYGFQPTLSFFFAYVFIIIFFFIIYHIVSRMMGFCFFPNEAPLSSVEKVGGAILGFVRSTFIIGIILIGLLLTPIRFIEKSIRDSYVGLFYITTNLKIYTALADLALKKRSISYHKELANLFSKKEYLFGSQQ